MSKSPELSSSSLSTSSQYMQEGLGNDLRYNKDDLDQKIKSIALGAIVLETLLLAEVYFEALSTCFVYAEAYPAITAIALGILMAGALGRVFYLHHDNPAVCNPKLTETGLKILALSVLLYLDGCYHFAVPCLSLISANPLLSTSVLAIGTVALMTLANVYYKKAQKEEKPHELPPRAKTEKETKTEQEIEQLEIAYQAADKKFEEAKAAFQEDCRRTRESSSLRNSEVTSLIQAYSKEMEAAEQARFEANRQLDLAKAYLEQLRWDADREYQQEHSKV